MYIRTENDVYKKREDTYIENNILYQIGYDFGRINLGEVINQADTIEELCDEFVMEEKMREVVFHHKTHNFNDFKNIALLKENYILYGAIWTSKGLIYVAKMNEKGELCLI